MKRESFEGVLIQTAGDLDDLEVTGASVDADQLALMLASSPVLRVRNQDGIELDLFFDMDAETLVAATVSTAN